MTLPVASLTGTIQPFWVGYIDIDGDVVRVTTLPYDWMPSATGDADLDGHLFESLPAAFIEITPVTHAEGGSDTVNATLSGIPGGDTSLLAALADPTKWRGRVARLWRGLADGAFVPTLLENYYTGYVMGLAFAGDPAGQTVTLSIENYLAVLTTARGRTYQDQAEHDALDQSPARIRAAANGMQTATGVGGGGGISGRIGESIRTNLK